MHRSEVYITTNRKDMLMNSAGIIAPLPYDHNFVFLYCANMQTKVKYC